jgi:hypothetical protein
MTPNFIERFVDLSSIVLHASQTIDQLADAFGSSYRSPTFDRSESDSHHSSLIEGLRLNEWYEKKRYKRVRVRITSDIRESIKRIFAW